MLLESIVCFRNGDTDALSWLEDVLSDMALRWVELDRLEKPK